jgi:multidrug efflux pump
MQGPAAEFPGAVAKTVVFSLLGSFVIAHTVVAAVIALTSSGEKPAPGAAWFRAGMATPRLTALFRRTLAGALRHPLRAILVILLLPLTGLLIAPFLEKQFFPASDRDLINLEVYLPAAASLQATRAAVDEIDARLRAHPEIRSLHWFLGRSMPAYWYSLLRRHDGMQNFAQAMIHVDSFEVVQDLAPRLQAELDAAFPGAQILVRELIQGPPYNAPVELRLLGPDLQVLRQHGEALRALALAMPEVTHARAGLGEAIPRVVVDLPEAVVRQSGLSLAEASRQLQAALSGVVQGSVTEATEDVPVRVRIDATQRRGAPDLAAMQFVLGEGRATAHYSGIPLDALGAVRLDPARGSIQRRDGQRENAVEIYVRSDVLASVVLQDLQQLMQESGFELPPGYRIEIGGEDEKQRWASELLMEHVKELLVLLLMVLVLSFNSFRLGAVIMLVGAMAIALGLLVVAVSGIPFGFVIVFALMALMGLAINAAIVVLAELKSDEGCLRGEHAAIIEATCRCGRHIIATTATTVLGLMPLALDNNAFFSSMARPVAGGTLLATLLSLYLVPVLFMMLTRRRPFALHA